MQSVFGIAFGDFGINVEIAGRVIAAAHHGQFQAGGGGGQGAGSTHRGSGRAVDKTEEIAGARHQSSGIGLGRKTCVGFGFNIALGNDLCEGRIGGHLVTQSHRIVRARELGVGPKDHAVRQGVAAGHTVKEIRLGVR